MNYFVDLNKTLQKINASTLRNLYEEYDNLLKKVLEESPFRAGSLSIIENEYGFPDYLKIKDMKSIKNKFIERILVVEKDANSFVVNNEISFNTYSIEEILNNRCTSFRFIFEGKSYYIKDDIEYLKKLISTGYLSSNFLENAKKRFEEYQRKEDKKEYKNFSEFLEKVSFPIKYESFILGVITLDRRTREIDFEKYLEEAEIKYVPYFKKLFFQTEKLNYYLKQDFYKLELFEEIIEKKEKSKEYTLSHSLNVNCLYLDFLKYLSTNNKIKLTSLDYLELKLGSYFHDIGKIMIPSEILLKPGKLTLEEYEIVKSHPINGIRFLNDIFLPPKTVDIILLHHESLNGKGYPFMIKNIPEHVQYFTIVDIFEALMGKRPYKKESTLEEALKILEEDAKRGKLNLEFVFQFEDYVLLKLEKFREKKILDKKEEKIKEILKK